MVDLVEGRNMNANNVLDFWFEELSPSQWFDKDPELDNQIKNRFNETLKSAAKGELYSWRETPRGRLAEIIVLDQFSRNIHRDSPEAFENDQLALILAQEMVHFGLDQDIDIGMRAFVYMPYMHSESKIIHEEAIRLFSVEGLEGNFNFEVGHKKIIDQFGRYPHRNEILNRPSTQKEIEFLKTHDGF